MDNTINPCPLCGGAVKIEYSKNFNQWMMECEDCHFGGATGDPPENYEEVVKQWNDGSSFLKTHSHCERCGSQIAHLEWTGKAWKTVCSDCDKEEIYYKF